MSKKFTTIDEYLELKAPGDDAKQERILHRLPKGMPLKHMQEIESDQVWSINMFTESGWKELHKACRGVTRHSSGEKLSEGFSEFLRIWQEDNGLIIDVSYPDETRNKVEVFYEEDGDRYVFYRFEKSLLEDLMMRWSEYLLGD